MSEYRRGLAYGVAAYGLWGIAPLFWKLLAGVSWVEILAHRALWGLFALAAIVRLAGATPSVHAALRDRTVVAAMALSGVLLVINWGTFVAAVIGGHILEASLGYFVNPLISLAFGVVALGERLRRLQWLALALATTGVAILTWRAGRLPWISLVLATSFGVYGLVRKLARVESLAGSTVETAMLAPIAAIYLAVLAARGGGQLGHAATQTQLLLLATGVVTVAPLLCFTSAARRLPLSTVGFLQFLGPSTQFVLAVALYGEPLAHDRLVAFVLIWLALAAFSIDLVRQSTQPNRPVI